MTADTVERANENSNLRDSNCLRHSNTAMRDGCSKSDQRSTLPLQVALLTGGGDRPYALGLASALISQGIFLDFIGSDEVNAAELGITPQVNFLNLRGDQRQQASFARKVLRVLVYYIRLMRYAATANPTLFHVLWNNKFEFFDRIVLMLYYKILGKKITFTVHNVNARSRDSNDTWLNRITLRFQYHMADHIFVHNIKGKNELLTSFHIPESKVSVIPFGINDTVPNSGLSTVNAKRMLGVSDNDKTMLFFGNIAPYKGLEYLIAAMAEVTRKSGDYRLILAGRLKHGKKYWNDIQETITRTGIDKRIIQRIEYIPDEEVELYFKAADVLILPYTYIFQSGVLFLGYNFGLPVIAADVGSLREDIIEGETGLVFKAGDAVDLAKTIDAYFASPLFRTLESRREAIRNYAQERYSWDKVGAITKNAYVKVL